MFPQEYIYLCWTFIWNKGKIIPKTIVMKNFQGEINIYTRLGTGSTGDILFQTVKRRWFYTYVLGEDQNLWFTTNYQSSLNF